MNIVQLIINKGFFQIMSEDELNNEVFALDDDENNREPTWINELRLALERGCDLGSIRNIGKCRPLTNDLRLAVWKVSRRICFC